MPKHKLTILLIKPEFQNLNDVIKDDVQVDFYSIKEEFNLRGYICIGANTVNPPEWQIILNEGASQPLPNLVNTSTRAVLFVFHQEHIFAFVFGLGRFLIKEEVIVRDFGIKVVLNSVDPLKLRSVDTSTFDEITVHSRTQTSRISDINNFGVDIVRDFLRAVTGVPINEELGSVITGRDSVQFNYEFRFSNASTLCEYVLHKYQSADYRTHFEWVDNLQYVTDPVIISTLNSKLIEAISQEDNSKLHLAPPEIIDWDHISGFSFTPRGTIFDDLKIEGFFELIRERDIELSVERIKRKNIYVRDNLENVVTKWSIYNSLVFETETDDETYVLTVGHWFKINKQFVDIVQDYLDTIDDSNIDLPPCRLNEKEGEYNDRVGVEVEHVLTLDRQFVYYNGTPIELCDLLTSDKKFIHVKPWASSSTLSHLFSQGRVAAEILLNDIEFRRLSHQTVCGLDASFGDTISVDQMVSRDYEIVFAVIDSDTRSLTVRLPFFSKLNMMQNIKFLRSIGFTVTKKKILRV